MTIGNMPIGGAQPPNAVIGGIMAAILAIATDLEPNAAVGLTIPFASAWSARRYPGLHAYVPAYVHGR